MRTWCLAILMVAGLMAPAQGQVASPQARPPSGGVLDRFLAPPSGFQQDFVGTWNLTWHDPADPACPCHGTLTIQVDESMDNAGNLKGYWSLKGGRATLIGGTAYDNNAWAGRFSQADDVDFPLKGHFRLEARDGGRALTGSYQRDGTAIPMSWSATRR
jgi:hypothetical protein